MRSAFVLLRTLGDVILGNTLVKEIREQTSEIDYLCWFINKEYENIPKNNPYINSLFFPDDWDDVLLELIKNKYDKVFIPYQTQHTDTYWHQTSEYGNLHLLDFYALRCRIKIKDRKLLMFPDDKDFEKVKDFKDKKYIIIHTTTGVPTKDWDLNKFNILSSRLKDSEFRIIQVGSKNDKPLKDIDLDLRDKLTFTEITALLKDCYCFVGLDSGISYLAGASGCKSIVLQGSTIPVTSGPFTQNIIHIVSETGCQPVRCHANCEKGNPCINSIDVNTVFDKVI